MAPEAAVFLCRRCSLAFALQKGRLEQERVRSAAVTSQLAAPGLVRYLAVWRFAARAVVKSKSTPAGMPPQLVWERLQRVAEPSPAYLYAPAFSLQRLVVQELGAGLVERQPPLVLEGALPAEQPAPPRLAVAEDGSWDFALDPGFATLSPILLTREDARAVAHFVYLAVESRSTPNLRGIDYELDLGEGELLFLPAAYDRRHIRDCNWRWLFEEFDDLVA